MCVRRLEGRGCSGVRDADESWVGVKVRVEWWCPPSVGVVTGTKRNRVGAGWPL